MPPTGFLPFQQDSWRGEVSESAQPHLNEILDLLNQPDDGRILKAGSSRKVWVRESEVGPLCLKEYRDPKLSDRLARMVRGSRAKREWKRLKKFHDNSVPIPEPILWAEGSDPNLGPKSLVLTKFIESSYTLGDILDGKKEVQGRWKLIQSGGIALAKMHSIGARHDDLHAGNLLVTYRKEEPDVLIMDLHQVRLRMGLTWNARLKNLATLFGGLRWKLTEREKHHGLKGYLETLTDWSPPFRSEREARYSMGRALEKFGRTYYRKRCRQRIAKCQESGKRFQRIQPGEYVGWIREEWNCPELLERLENPNGWIESEDCRVLKHTPTTTVARAKFDAEKPALFLKRYNRKDWWEKTKNLFRYSRAMKVWRAGYGLEVMEIPTPKVVAALEKRKGPILLESFILTQWTEDGVGLDDFWNERATEGSSNPFTPEERKVLRREVARLFGRLHDMRVSHGDLKGRNVLIDPSAPSPYNPEFVDLDAIQLRPWRFKRSRINDLSRLLFSVYPNAPLLTQVRFFRDYCGQDRALWDQRKEWFARIQKRTRRKLREKGLVG
ncbi:MAG: hypothetical protein H6752_02570 [Candidatus Omnitrophica bacterium]|nr:hypothetical protein [Candidatus Omnitrophota bacterium]